MFAPWGATVALARPPLRELPPATLALLRASLPALALLASLRLLGHGWPSRRWPWGAFVVMGLLNNALPFSLIFLGQTAIAAVDDRLLCRLSAGRSRVPRPAPR